MRRMLREFDCNTEKDAKEDSGIIKLCENTCNVLLKHKNLQTQWHTVLWFNFNFMQCIWRLTDCCFWIISAAVLDSIPKLWERATGQSAHQHRRSQHSAQTWLDTTAQSQRPSDTGTMDLSDRLPIWPPPRNPNTFLAPQRFSAAKGAWVRVECLPLKHPTPPQEINGNPLSWRQRKSSQIAVGYISLKLREWRTCPKLWEVFNL